MSGDRGAGKMDICNFVQTRVSKDCHSERVGWMRLWHWEETMVDVWGERREEKDGNWRVSLWLQAVFHVVMVTMVTRRIEG